MQRCCSGFGHTHPHLGRHQPSAASQPRPSTGGAPQTLGFCTRIHPIQGKRLLPPSSIQGGKKAAPGFGAPFPITANSQVRSALLRLGETCRIPLSSGGDGEAGAGGCFGHFLALQAMQVLPAPERSRGWSWEERGGLRLCHLWLSG